VSNSQSAHALVVSELFPPTIGGSGILLANLYRRLKSVAVTVVTDGPVSTATHAETGLPLVKLPMHHRVWGLLNAESAGTYLSVARAIASASRSKRTIAYCARALPEGFAALIARKVLNGPPYVVWTHGEELVTYQTSRELTLLLRLVHRHAAAVIANSENTRRMLEEVGVPSSKISVVYPGVDAARFLRGERSATRTRLGLNDQLVLLSVGRLQSRKGHDLVIRSMARLRSVRPDIRYLIVGDGDERPRLERLVREEGLGDAVRFAGKVPDEQLPDYYSAADVFVHPNRIDDDGDVEGFGMVFLEAAAAGLPVVGGNSGGVPEAVDHLRTGLLVGGRDVDEFVAAVLRLCDAPVLRTEMGQAGRQRVADRFSWSTSVEALNRLHSSLQHTLWPA
jgi:phosphatidylinositol alpha-1,6-mannosyltransferase